MKKFLTMALTVWLTGCVSLSYQEKIELMKLQQKGIDATVSANGWDKPASPALAGFLNLFPGFGNFYLGSGDAAEGAQIGYGIANLLLWPLSVVWGIPQAYSDADTINKRDLVFFYQYTKNKQTKDFFADGTDNDAEFPQWVELYEKEGYIGQTDRKALYFIGYGESILYKPAHDYAIEDAYEKAKASIAGYGDSLKNVKIRGMKLVSEYKHDDKGKVRVWMLYSYPKKQLEKDMLEFQKKE